MIALAFDLDRKLVNHVIMTKFTFIQKISSEEALYVM